VKVIMSGGFATAYRSALPEFERTTGIAVTTGSGASQGNGPETIGAQLRRGVPADMVIMSREGLNDLIAEGRIVAGTDVNLAQTPLGVAVRAGAPSRTSTPSMPSGRRCLTQSPSLCRAAPRAFI